MRRQRHRGAGYIGQQVGKAGISKHGKIVVQMPYRSLDIGFGAGSQQETVLYIGLETGICGKRAQSCDGGGIGPLKLERHKRNQGATVVKRHCHGHVRDGREESHQRRGIRRNKGTEQTGGVRYHLFRRTGTVEYKDESRIGRNGPQNLPAGTGIE